MGLLAYPSARVRLGRLTIGPRKELHGCAPPFWTAATRSPRRPFRPPSTRTRHQRTGTRERRHQRTAPENGQAHARHERNTRERTGRERARGRREEPENGTREQRTDRHKTGQRTENGQAQVRGREPKHLKKDIKKDRRSPNPKRPQKDRRSPNRGQRTDRHRSEAENRNT